MLFTFQFALWAGFPAGIGDVFRAEISLLNPPQCSSGECIDINLVCNFVSDCPGSEDEAECPVHFDFDSCGDLLG